MSYNAGTVFLQVVPSYDNFQRSLKRQAETFGKAMEAELNKSTGNAVADAIDKQGPSVKKASERLGDDAGKTIGGRMHQAIQANLDKAIKSLPKVIIDADTKKADREIAVMRGRLEEIRDAHIKMDLDSGSAQAQIAQVLGELEVLHRTAQRGSDIDIDTGAAMMALARVEATADAATRDRTINVDVDDSGGLERMIARTRNLTGSGDDAANSFRAFNAVLLAAITIGPALIPIIAGIAGGLGALVPLLGAAGLGLGAVVLGLSGIPGAVSAMNDAQKNASKDALAASKTMRSASDGVRDAEQALSRARQDAARTQSDAARRVADARRSLADAERQSAQSIKAAVDREADARQNLSDVTRKVNRDIENAERRLADAQRDVTRAREDAARRNTAAAEAITRAENRVVEAQQAATKAQEDLMDARRQAQDDLEDLALKSEGGLLAEREAVLAVADAKKEYDRVMGREFKSARAVEDVTIAYEQAQLALERIRLENGRTAEEMAEASVKGVEGSDLVVAAQERITSAQQDQADAAKEVADAHADADQTKLDGIQSVNDALRDQRDAQRELRQSEADGAREIREAQNGIIEAAAEVRRVRADGARDVADAERGVTDALREQRRAAVDSAQSIADAHQRMADAQLAYQDALTQTSVLGSASMQKLHQEMDKLSPAGKNFAEFIFGLKGFFKELRGAAETGLLPGLQNFLSEIIDTYGPGFTKWVGKMAKVAGDLFDHLGDVMKTPVWREFFREFGKLSPKLFRQFGETTINWLTVFIALMDAFLPLAEKASQWLLDLSKRAKDWATNLEDTQGFKDFMGWLERILPKVGDFFSALWDAIKNLVVALAPLGEFMLEFLTGVADFIAKIPPGLLGAIIMGFIGLTFAIQGTLAIVSLALSAFTILATPLGIWAFVILAVVAALVILYIKIDWFRTAVNILFDAIKWIFVHTFEAVGAAAVWLWDKVLSPTWDLIKAGWRALADAAQWAWKNVLEPVWDAVSAAATWLWEKVLSPVFGFIKAAWRVLADTIGWVWNNIWFPIIDLITTIIWDLWKLYFKAVFTLISEGWKAVAEIFGLIWNQILKPALDTIGAGIAWVWKNVIKPIFDVFMDVVGNQLVGAFNTAIEAIGKAWDGIKDIAKAPVKFIIDTVINNGFIDTFNKIAGFFGTKEMGHIPLPKGWATGGYTGQGGRFEPAGIVHRDEYVISSPARRSFEGMFPGALDYINSTGRFPGYANGGVVRPVRGPYGLPFGNTYSDGSFHSGQDFPVPIGTVVRAAMAAVVKTVQHLSGSYGNNIVLKHLGGSETLYAHLFSTGVNPGDVVGPGTVIGLSGTSGNSTGPHLHFEFRKPPGGYSNAINPLGMLGGSVEGKDDDGGFFPSWMSNPFNYLKDKVEGLLDKMGDSPYAGLLGGMPRHILGMAKDGIVGLAKGVFHKAGDVASGAWDFVNGPFGGRGDGDNGTMMYDNGGYLPPGLTTVMNATGRPEPVFTEGQWSSLQRAGGGDGTTPGVHIGTMVAADIDEAVSKIRTSQSDAAAIADLRSIAAGV